MWPLSSYLSNYLHFHFQINIIRITEQLAYFKQYQQRVSALIGEEQTRNLVNKALVLITLGGNDFVNNYYLVPFSARSREYALPDYVVFLISEYRKILAVSHPSTLLVFRLIFFYSWKLNKISKDLQPTNIFLLFIAE